MALQWCGKEALYLAEDESLEPRSLAALSVTCMGLWSGLGKVICPAPRAVGTTLVSQGWEGSFKSSTV